jgi:hypothetical protein
MSVPTDHLQKSCSIEKETCILCNTISNTQSSKTMRNYSSKIEKLHLANIPQNENIYSCACLLPVHKLCLIKLIILTQRIYCINCKETYILRFKMINDFCSLAQKMGKFPNLIFQFFLLSFCFICFIYLKTVTNISYFLIFLMLLIIIYFVKQIKQIKSLSLSDFIDIICFTDEKIRYKENNGFVISRDYKNNLLIIYNFLRYILNLDVGLLLEMKKMNNDFSKQKCKLDEIINENNEKFIKSQYFTKIIERKNFSTHKSSKINLKIFQLNQAFVVSNSNIGAISANASANKSELKLSIQVNNVKNLSNYENDSSPLKDSSVIILNNNKTETRSKYNIIRPKEKCSTFKQKILSQYESKTSINSEIEILKNLKINNVPELENSGYEFQKLNSHENLLSVFNDDLSNIYPSQKGSNNFVYFIDNNTKQSRASIKN